jgi:hypothetical protein
LVRVAIFIYKWWIPIWQPLEEAWLCDDESLCTLYQPYLEENFDKAVAFAKTLTEEKIEQWNKDQKTKYSNHIRKLREARAKRNKTAYI